MGKRGFKQIELCLIKNLKKNRVNASRLTSMQMKNTIASQIINLKKQVFFVYVKALVAGTGLFKLSN